MTLSSLVTRTWSVPRTSRGKIHRAKRGLAVGGEKQSNMVVAATVFEEAYGCPCTCTGKRVRHTRERRLCACHRFCRSGHAGCWHPCRRLSHALLDRQRLSGASRENRRRVGGGVEGFQKDGECVSERERVEVRSLLIAARISGMTVVSTDYLGLP